MPTPIWVEKEVLTEIEIEELRKNGIDLTVFTMDTRAEPAVETVQMHHPNDVIWVEH